MKEVRVGIIGLGNMGTTHAHNLDKGEVPNMRLTAICDIAQARRDYAGENFPEAAVFENAQDMYRSGLIDAVIIAVPHYDHPPLAIAAFEKGLHMAKEYLDRHPQQAPLVTINSWNEWYIQSRY